MQRIIHISDLHFGTEYSDRVQKLISTLNAIDAEVIVVSGDLTQRAKTDQFQAAQLFLQSLNKDILCVPGNHDISLYDMPRRFFKTYERYQTYISQQLSPAFCSVNLSILGINSASPYKAKAGIIVPEQIAYIKDFFSKQPEKNIKILVMHHNLLKSERHKNIQNAEEVIKLLVACKVNLILSGHLHCPYVEQIKRDWFNQVMYMITAGTPISNRINGLKNSFNIIEFEDDRFKFIVKEFAENEFITVNEENFLL